MAHKNTHRKKSAAQRKPSAPARPATARPAAARPMAGRAAAASPEVAPRAEERSQPTKVDFSTEYHYVLSDLKRFGILAAGMFVLLVVLALTLG